VFPSSKLKLNSVPFAVIWTIGMLCWERPFDVAKAIVIVVLWPALAWSLRSMARIDPTNPYSMLWWW
jgi:hypothetical protein